MAKKNRNFEVDGKSINLYSFKDDDYLSLTDIAKQADDEPRFILRNWLSTQKTIAYLGEWEIIHNPDFNRAGFRTVKDEFFEKPYSLTPKKWIESTNAKGIISKAGRYNGGTYAHKDIAINFCYWLSPTFQIYLIKEFQRLKELEAKEQKDTLEWDVRRILSKVNYKIQTDAIKKNLIPSHIKSNVKGAYYASEADLLNVAMFGMTAKAWNNINEGQKSKGNLRDNATPEQLLVLANLETHNAEFIKEGLSQEERLGKLNEIAIYQMQLLVNIDL
jgi:hypothetical protein